MIALILITLSFILLGGFLALTEYETQRGIRFHAPFRSKLDQTTSHIQFILANVDLAAFVRDEVRHLIERIGHDSVHLSLVVVRAVERTLTRLVRYLRAREAATIAPRESARAFVKTLTDFKDSLNATHPEISDIK